MLTFSKRLIFIFQPIFRSKIGKKLIVWLLLHMDFALPIDRLYESDTILAFFHPQPSYPFHVLLIPKSNIPDLQSLNAGQANLLAEIITTCQKIISDYQLNQYGYRLIVNGGNYKEYPILHFHLISDEYPQTTTELT